MKAPTMDEWVEKIGNKAINEFTYKGKTLKEWIELMASGTEWIPVSERLPEEDGEYLVTVLDSYSGRPFVDISHYFIGNVNNKGFYKAYEVMAWMQLPEPHKEDNTDGNS